MRWLLTLVCLSLASVSTAQTIHQYPYDPAVTAYATPVAWPVISAQCHLRPANSNPDPTTVPQLMSPSLGHTHVDVQPPLYGEISQNFTVNFTITLFDVDGYVNFGMYGELLNPAVWDTPDGSQPPMVGDPHGVKTFTGHVMVNLSKADGSGNVGFDIPKHGWFSVGFSTRTIFTNGYRTDTQSMLAFYSMIDPTAPETQLQGQHLSEIGSFCKATSPFDTPPDAIGQWQAALYQAYVPILSPLTRAVTQPVAQLYGYGTAALPNGIGETRFDMDLHHGNGGTPIAMASGPSLQGVFLPSPFDPAILGPGVHKVAAGWEQNTGAGVPGVAVANEEAVAWLVVTVNVGGVVPPVEVWSTWILQHGNLSGNLRACPDASGVGCVGVMKN